MKNETTSILKIIGSLNKKGLSILVKTIQVQEGPKVFTVPSLRKRIRKSDLGKASGVRNTIPSAIGAHIIYGGYCLPSDKGELIKVIRNKITDRFTVTWIQANDLLDGSKPEKEKVFYQKCDCDIYTICRCEKSENPIE